MSAAEDHTGAQCDDVEGDDYGGGFGGDDYGDGFGGDDSACQLFDARLLKQLAMPGKPLAIDLG